MDRIHAGADIQAKFKFRVGKHLFCLVAGWIAYTSCSLPGFLFFVKNYSSNRSLLLHYVASILMQMRKNL